MSKSHLFIALSQLAAMFVLSSGCKMAATGHNIEGVRLHQQGQFQAAMQRFQQSVAANPKDADAYYNMAATAHQMATQRNDAQLYQQAETLYNNCLDLNENHTECHRGLAVLLTETNRSDRAFSLLKNWADRSRDIADPRVELARLYDEFGDKETAQIHLQEALNIDKHCDRAWRAMGRLREESGDTMQAIANYQRSYNLNSFQPEVAQRIATLNRSVTSSLNGSAAGGTRTVTPVLPGVRY